IGIITASTMALRFATSGAHTRRPAGKIIAPALQLLGGELGKLDVSQRRQDVSIGAATQNPERCPCATLCLQGADIRLDPVAYRADPATHLELTGGVLRVFVREDDGAVGVAEVVGRAEGVIAVLALDVEAGEPLSSAGARLAVTEMQCRL